MYNIKLENYIPAPKPATTDRIVAAHYYPSWTKGGNTLNHEFEDDFPYPERTPLIGFYEDRNPEVVDWEIKQALEHGINCFIFCWYRKRDNVGKPVTVDALRLGKGLHEGFLKARYNPMMQFAVMFETCAGRWGAADHDDLLENVLPFWMREYFSKENYLRIDGKPVVFLHDGGQQLYHMLGDSCGMKKALDDCREAAKKAGYNGLIFAQNLADGAEGMQRAKDSGVDFSFMYSQSVVTGREVITSEEAYQIQLSATTKYLSLDPLRFVPTVSPFGDTEPRVEGMLTIHYARKYWYANFKDYRRLLRMTKALSDAAPENSFARKMIMVDCVNEWDEGHFLLPSYRFGYKHLQCIREELTERDNLPDYRTPEALGFAPYDEVWGGRAIDLSQYNDRKLDDGEFTQHRYHYGLNQE